MWLFTRFGGFASWVARWFRQKGYSVYVRAMANIYARCVVIIPGHCMVHENSWDNLIQSGNS